MDRLSRLNLSPQTRARFDALIEEAPALGISSQAVASAGMPGLRTLLALRQAVESGAQSSRKRHLGELQSTIATLQRWKHFDLVAQLQARATALQGRGNDTEIAHVTRGEIVVPRQVQTPQVLAALNDALSAHNIPLDMLRVGNALNHINPSTGAPEFGVMDWISGLFSKDENNAPPTAEDPGGQVRIVQSPYSPCDPRYIEELENAKAYAREFPSPKANPVVEWIASQVNRRMLEKEQRERDLRPGPVGIIPRG